MIGGLGQVGLFIHVMEVVGEVGQGVYSGQGVFIGEVVDSVQVVSTRDVAQGGQEGGTGQGGHSEQVVTV